MTDPEFRQLLVRTRDNLKEAQRSLQRMQSCLKAAKSFHALTGNEQKLIDRCIVNACEPYDDIQTVVDAINIQLK